MEFKTILGFLGLLSIAVLILIYILKPNYMQKTISSSYVWKLSLKYRKKRIPINRFKQLLILICQVLILTFSAFILTQPLLVNAYDLPKNEKIIVIDASASMLAMQGETSRFEVAVLKAKALARESIEKNGLITVILAGKKADYVKKGDFIAARTDLIDSVDEALDEVVCTFGRADIDGAMLMSGEILVENYSAKIVLFTATTYTDYGKDVEVIDISQRDENGKKTEWNAAILDSTAYITEGYFKFSVKLASYNEDRNLTVFIEVNNAYYNIETVDDNDDRTVQQYGPKTVMGEKIVYCTANEPVTVDFLSFIHEDTDEFGKVFSFNDAQIYIIENDTFAYDNTFSIFGGTREKIDVLYMSTVPNDFMRGVLNTVRRTFESRWDLTVDVYKYTDEERPAYSGYDFYIFEHEMPFILPTDGIVLLIDPDIAPEGSSFAISGRSAFDGVSTYAFSGTESSPIMKNVSPENIIVTRYTRVVSMADDLVPIMFYSDGDDVDADPVFLVKNEDYAKMAVFAFDLHYSYLPVFWDFPILFVNLFDYFLPSTISKKVDGLDTPRYVFDVNEQITLNARGPELEISGPDFESIFKKPFPQTVSMEVPGPYTVSQQSFRNTLVERFFIKIPEIESDFSRIGTFRGPGTPKKPTGLDLIMYLASTLVGLLFIERFLHFKNEY